MKQKTTLIIVGITCLLFLGAGVASAGCGCEDESSQEPKISFNMISGVIAESLSMEKNKNDQQTNSPPGGSYHSGDNILGSCQGLRDAILEVFDEEVPIGATYYLWVETVSMYGFIPIPPDALGKRCAPYPGQYNRVFYGDNVLSVASDVQSWCFHYNGMYGNIYCAFRTGQPNAITMINSIDVEWTYPD